MKTFIYELSIVDLGIKSEGRLLFFQRTTQYCQLIAHAKSVETEFNKQSEEEFSWDSEAPLRMYLTIKVDDTREGYMEAPTVEMLEEKVGSFERHYNK